MINKFVMFNQIAGIFLLIAYVVSPDKSEADNKNPGNPGSKMLKIIIKNHYFVSQI